MWPKVNVFLRFYYDTMLWLPKDLDSGYILNTWPILPLENYLNWLLIIYEMILTAEVLTVIREKKQEDVLYASTPGDF